MFLLLLLFLLVFVLLCVVTSTTSCFCLFHPGSGLLPRNEWNSSFTSYVSQRRGERVVCLLFIALQQLDSGFVSCGGGLSVSDNLKRLYFKRLQLEISMCKYVITVCIFSETNLKT